jgi:hypothetical protein
MFDFKWLNHFVCIFEFDFDTTTAKIFGFFDFEFDLVTQEFTQMQQSQKNWVHNTKKEILGI